LQLNIHGIPPKPNMVTEMSSPPEDHLSETTVGELEAGRKALTENEQRKKAEQDAGRKAIAHLQRRAHSAPVNSESEEE
jgi:hypothetical protein